MLDASSLFLPMQLQNDFYGGGMMEMEEKEQLPAGIITMLLTGYVDTIAFQRKLIYASLAGWAITTIAFIVYK